MEELESEWELLFIMGVVVLEKRLVLDHFASDKTHFLRVKHVGMMKIMNEKAD